MLPTAVPASGICWRIKEPPERGRHRSHRRHGSARVNGGDGRHGRHGGDRPHGVSRAGGNQWHNEHLHVERKHSIQNSKIDDGLQCFACSGRRNLRHHRIRRHRPDDTVGRRFRRRCVARAIILRLRWRNHGRQLRPGKFDDRGRLPRCRFDASDHRANRWPRPLHERQCRN